MWLYKFYITDPNYGISVEKAILLSLLTFLQQCDVSYLSTEQSSLQIFYLYFFQGNLNLFAIGYF